MDCNESCSIPTSPVSKEYGHLDTNGLVVLISSEIPLTILDARVGKWDDGKRIGAAQHLSYEATAEEAAKMIPNKKALIVVYCSNLQCPASTGLAKRLTELGYPNILQYEAGIQEWIKSGHPVRETK